MGTSQVVLVVKNPPANVGDTRDGWEFDSCFGKIPRGGNGNPLKHSCLENSTGREAWWATVQGASKNRTRLNNWAKHKIKWSQQVSPTLIWLVSLSEEEIRKREKAPCLGNSLAVQWLGLHAFTAEGAGSIPGWGTKIPKAVERSKK